MLWLVAKTIRSLWRAQTPVEKRYEAEYRKSYEALVRSRMKPNVAHAMAAAHARSLTGFSPADPVGPHTEEVAAAATDLPEYEALVTQAQVSGDWSEVLEALENQSAENDGRFNHGMFAAVEQGIVSPALKVNADFLDLIAEFDRASPDRQVELVTDPEKSRLRKEWSNLFGDGESLPGTLEPVIQRLTALQQRRDGGPAVSDTENEPSLEEAGSALGSEWDWRCLVCSATVSDNGWGYLDPLNVAKPCDGGCRTVISRTRVSHDDGRGTDYIFMFLRPS